MVNKDRLVNTFLQYVQIDSITRHEGNFAKTLKRELEGLGLHVYVDDAGEKVGADTGNIIAKLEGNKKSQPIMFCAHMDTVSPGEGVKPVIKDDVIYSDGTTVLGSDDKTGIAEAVEALRVIKEDKIPHGDIEIVFNIAEEGGLHGAKNLDYSKIDSKLAFVLDGGDGPGAITVQGPAQDTMTVKILGKAAHAGARPEQGISAIQIAAEAIDKMKLLRVDEETTANIGVIKGGSATNIVCPEVEMQAEARSLDPEKLKKQTSHMLEEFQNAAKKHGGAMETEVTRSYEAMKIDENDAIVHIAKKAGENIGLKPFTRSTGGGSDTHILNANGIKAVNLGKGGEKAHTVEEYVKIEEMVVATNWILEIIKTV